MSTVSVRAGGVGALPELASDGESSSDEALMQAPIRYAQGLRWLGAAGAGDAQAQSSQRPSVRVPRPSGRPEESAVARWAADVLLSRNGLPDTVAL